MAGKGSPQGSQGVGGFGNGLLCQALLTEHFPSRPEPPGSAPVPHETRVEVRFPGNESVCTAPHDKL